MSRFLTKTSRNSVGASTTSKRKQFFSFALATVLMSTIVPVLSPTAANAGGAPPVTKTVTFDSNAATSEIKTQTSSSSASLNSNTFVRAGYRFSNWDTARTPSNSSTSYEENEIYLFNKDLTLFAQWTLLPSHTVTFNANGGSGVMSAQTSNVSLQLTSNSFVNEGFIFSGWTTAANPSSPGVENYSNQQNWDFSKDLNLFAQWSAIDLGVTYLSLPGIVFTTDTVKTNGKLALSAAPTRAGYSYAGWLDSLDVIAGFPGDLYTHGKKSNFQLHAKWDADSLTVSYDSKGGSSVGNGSVKTDASLTLPATPTRTAYSFTGWYDASEVLAGLGGATYSHGKTSDFKLHAKWDANKFKVTFKVKGVKYSDEQTETGGSINKPADPRYDDNESCEFDGWYDSDDHKATFDSNGKYSHGHEGEFELDAEWTNCKHTVTYALDGGSGTLPTQASVAEGASFNTAASTGLTKDGYAFSKWNDGSTNYTAGDPYLMGTSNVTLTAIWTVIGRTVTFHSNYYLGGADYVQTSENQTGLIPNKFVRPGYTFLNWSTNPGPTGLGAIYDYSEKNLYPFSQSNSDLYAQWTENAKHTVTYALDGGSGTLPTQVDVAEGASFNTAASTGLTKAGFTFNKWNDGSTNYSAGASYLMGTSNVTLTAIWTAVIVPVLAPPAPVVFISVTYLANGGNGAAPTQANIQANGLFIVGTTMTRAGYTFGGWRDQSTTLYQAGVTYIAGPSNVVFTAQWNPTSQTVTYLPGTGSGTVPTQGNVLTGGNFTVGNGAGLVKTGYTFVGWSEGTNTYAPGSTYTMGSGNVTLTANYLINNYAVSYTTDGNGSITGSTPQTVDYGNNGTSVTATPLAGYRFDSWSDGVTTATRSELNVVANVFATARFTAITYTATYTAGPNGSINGNSSQTIQYAGNTAPVTATPATGYRFTGWSDGNINATRSDLNITASLSVTANFELIPPVALEVLPVVTPTPEPAPVVVEPAAPAPAPLILPQAVVATTKTACDKPIVFDLSKNLAADGSSKVQIASLPKNGTLVQTSETTWTFTPAKNSCSLGGNDSIVFKITDKNGVVTTVTNNVVVSKQGNIPSKIKTGVPSINNRSNGVPMPELFGFAFLVLFSTIRRKLKNK